jgi:arabinofuranosyltransferase
VADRFARGFGLLDGLARGAPGGRRVIVYRYARNLAHGDGFVFNPGERVEGVTCFLWTLVFVPFAIVGIPLPRAGPVLSAIAGRATLALTARLHADAEGRDGLAGRDLLAPFLLAVTPAFAYWSVGALETVPFALLITARRSSSESPASCVPKRR